MKNFVDRGAEIFEEHGIDHGGHTPSHLIPPLIFFKRKPGGKVLVLSSGK